MINQTLTEAKEGKNVHLEHIEDMVFNEGVTGTRNAILFLDPADGAFFVAKKGLFNADPQMYKTVEDVKSKLSGELQDKFLVALQEFSKLGIKSGVYQGDLMFTKSDLSKEKIDGQDYLTFQPNTIVYAVPAASPLARKIRKAKIGVVWHTTYTGKTIEDMTASFGQSIVTKMKSSPSVWMDDATYKDVSGTATFTKEETANLTAMLSHAGKIFQKLPPKALNDIAGENEFLVRLKAFNNSKVRKGKTIVNARTHVFQLIRYFREYYKKEADKRSSDKGKQTQLDKANKLMTYFDNHKNDLIKIYEIVMLLTSAKNMVVNKLNQAGSIPTFLRTTSGFKVTEQEGYVAIDKVGGAVKLVDRMEFSRANFSPDVIKGWQK